jgi:hypothetical protein
MSDWREMVKQFREAQRRSDLARYQELREDFLENVDELIRQAREGTREERGRAQRSLLEIQDAFEALIKDSVQ